MQDATFSEPIAQHLWETRYRLAEDGRVQEPGIAASWERVALALSAPEAAHRDLWRRRFEGILAQFRFLPGGRILAGAGTGRRLTLFNCFATGGLHDSIGGIFQTLAEAMLTLQAGGGIGCDFSTLRPAGMRVAGTGTLASGPVSFMQVWDQACAAVLSTASRRGEMLATLRCDHPDIQHFINARRHAHALRHVKLAVLVTDALVRAVEQDAQWELLFPLEGRAVPEGAQVRERAWSGSTATEPCLVARTIGARALWQELQKAAIEAGDPAVIFIDRVERDNNLYYCETIGAASPGGEAPLPPHGASNLGAINLAQFVTDPFGAHPKLDIEALATVAGGAARLLDNVYEVSPFPLAAQKHAALACRRIGLGITGLADALAMLGVRYGAPASLDIAGEAMRVVCHGAYRASIEMAAERGAFPQYRPAKYLDSTFVRALPEDIQEAIVHKGIRNSHLTAIAASGATSVLANNVSSGIAPIAALVGQRSVRDAGGALRRMPARDYAWTLFCARHGEQAPLPDYLLEASDVAPLDQLKLQAAVQAHVDQAIAAPVLLPFDAAYEQHADLFMQAYTLGLKGCAAARASAAGDAVLAPPGERGGID